MNDATQFFDTTAAGGYQIERSLRFNSSDSAYLSWTPASSGNRKTWTWAGWVKRSELGTIQTLFGVDNGTGNDYFALGIQSDDTLFAANYSAYFRQTSQVLRDPSAWYHIVLAVDTTEVTAADRLKLYLNGSQISTFQSSSDPAQNTDLGINAAASHNIGRIPTPSRYFSGYLADIHFIDGQALDPTSFGEFDANGIWQPIAYTGTYGTNGFHLPFSDNSTAAALGTDTSGNGNTWTVNNISVAAGAGNDSLVDTPTNYGTDTGAGGEVRGNYATLNPLDNPGNTLSNGNLDLVGLGNSFHGVRSTIGLTSGKWYFECTINAEGGETRTGPGLYRPTDDLVGDYGNGTVVVYDFSGVLYVRDESGAGSTWFSTSGSISAGDVFGFAFDLDVQKVWVHQNGTWLNSGNPGAGTGAVVSSLPTGTYFAGGWAYSTSDSLTFNFGQRAFAYNSNRSGFKAICDTSLPAPVVAQPSTVMDVALYTGNGTSQTISGLGFSPDLVWYKSRSNGTWNHGLFDIVRGTSKQLFSNTTGAEGTYSGVTSFNSDGFTLGSDNGGNESGGSMVAWCWDAGSSTVTNTQGSITSQVRANPSAGFSIVTFTKTGGTSTPVTVGHGLGAEPHMIIVKNRDAADDWYVYTKVLGNTSRVQLNLTDAVFTGTAIWGSTTPTSTVFTVQSLFDNAHVAYCFAPVAGYSAFGSYTGNGLADGPFIYTGFRPKFIIWKASSAADNWVMTDSTRSPYNAVYDLLLPNSSAAESTYSNAYPWDYLSNGFKIRHTASNVSGTTYIYAAFAESPFQYARAR